MIKILYRDTTLNFAPLNNSNCIYGKYFLPNDWRERDLKNGGGSIALSMSGSYSISEESYKKMNQYGFFGSFSIDNGIEDGHTLTDFFIDNFSIGHSKINYKTFNYDLTGNIKSHFPTFQELQNLNLNDAICSKSYLSLGGFSEIDDSIKVLQIKFGKIKDNKINLFCKTQFELDGEIGEIIIEEEIPFFLWFEITGDKFVGLSAEERFKEIQNCIESVYDLSKYDITKTVTNKKTLRCEIILKNKNNYRQHGV